MMFTEKAVTQGVMVLANDHFVSIPYDCSELTANANGVIPAGTIIPANDATAVGVLLNDVHKDENPNGSLIIHGFIDKGKLPVEPADAAIKALSQITFIEDGAVVTVDDEDEETPDNNSGSDNNGGIPSILDDEGITHEP